MRRARVGPTTPQLSLFPFLAVLICTMGVLIVLLVLVTREANLEAEAVRGEAVADQQAQLQALQEERELQEIRAQLLDEMQPELQERLRQARLRRSHLEDQLYELRQQAEALQAELAALEAAPETLDLAATQAELTELEQQLAAEQEALESEQQDVQKRRSSYAVVPYPGPNGTRRRPIYIECAADGIWLRPYGIQLTDKELPSPLLAGNPLDAAILAIREYWQRYGKFDEEQGEPYPLLIVRPRGAAAYAAARSAMKSWDSEFGYELVDEETELVFPGKDPQLAEHLREVISAAEKRHAELQLALERRQQAVEFRGGDLAAAGSARGNGFAGSSRSTGQGTAGDGSGGGQGGGKVVLRAARRGGFVVQRQPGSRGGGAGTDWSLAGFSQGSSSNQVNGGSGESGSPTGSAGSQPGDSRRLSSAGSSSGAATSPGGPSSSGAGQIGTSGSPGGSSSSASSTTPGNFPGLQAPADQNQTLTLRQTGDAGAPGELTLQNPDGTPAAANQSLSPEMLEKAKQAMDLLRQVDPEVARQAAELSQSRGGDWALPSKTPTATAFRRPIAVRCGAGQFVIEAGNHPGQDRRVIEFDGETLQQLDAIVDGVWRHVDGWGFAGYNAYWKPELHVTVEPEGEPRFRELQALLLTSGLELKRRSSQ